MSAIQYHSLPHKQYMDLLFRRIGEYYGHRLISLAIFGSYARQENHPDSDLDLLLVVESFPSSRRTRRNSEFVEQIENYLDHHCEGLLQVVSIDISPLILTPEEAGSFLPLYMDMVDHHILLQDRDHFLEQRLEQVRQKMKRWGSRKKRCGTGWYWEIKPDLKWGEVIDYDQ